MSTVRKLISVNSLVAVTMAIGFLNNVAITGLFGLDRDVDAYFAGMILLNMFNKLVIDYLGRNFLPVYAHAFQQSPDSASALASTMVTFVFLLSSTTALVLWAGAGILYRLLLPGFSEGELQTVTTMFRIMSPVVVLIALDQIHDYIWQHEEKYLRVTMARLFLPLIGLATILAGHSTLGVYALPVGFVFGHAVSSVIRILNAPYRFRPNLRLADPRVRTVLRNSGALMASGSIARSRDMIVQYFASTLGEGAISAIALARRFCQPLSEAALQGVRMVIFARSAKKAARRQLAALGRLYRLGVMAILVGLIPAGVWLALDGEFTVRTFFMRGEFTGEMAHLVATVLLGMAFSIPLQGIGRILSDAFYALGKVRVPLILMPLATLVYFLAAWILSGRFGLLGLASATPVSHALLSLALLWLLARELESFSPPAVVAAIGRYAAFAVIAVVAAQQIRQISPITGWVAFLAGAVLVTVIYSSVIWLTRDGTVRELWQHFRAGLVSRRDAA